MVNTYPSRQPVSFRPVTFPRREFASERFDYEPGQKVIFAGRSQESGKTTLAFTLLEFVATPEMPAFVIQPKPRDPTTEKEGKRLEYRFVDKWPVEKKWGEIASREGPSGYIIQAGYGDLESDQERAAKVAGDVLVDRYKAGARHHKSIVVCDDTVVLSKLLGKDKEMVTIIAMGGAMDVGLWLFTQKATDSGKAVIWAYENSEHSFLAATRDYRNAERYAESAGHDKKLIVHCLSLLRKYQFLYVSGSGNICIVDSK